MNPENVSLCAQLTEQISVWWYLSTKVYQKEWILPRQVKITFPSIPVMNDDQVTWAKILKKNLMQKQNYINYNFGHELKTPGVEMKPWKTYVPTTLPAILSQQSSFYCHDIEAFPQEELLKLVKENPTDFIKCTFRVGTSGQQHRYYGQLPTPDSPDIDIPGRVQGVYEDDVVVLELQPRVWVQNEGGQEEILIFGYIKGKHNFKLFCLH